VLKAHVARYVFYSNVVEVLCYNLIFSIQKVMYLWSEKLSCSLHCHSCHNLTIVLSTSYINIAGAPGGLKRGMGANFIRYI